MSSRHLSCPDCRIRVLASDPEIDLLEGSCPICGATLRGVSSASEVVGFRSFDLDELSDGGSSAAPHHVGPPGDFVTRRLAAVERADFDAQPCDAQRWLDEGGSFAVEAVAECPAPR
jgi:hypothetical protein